MPCQRTISDRGQILTLIVIFIAFCGLVTTAALTLTSSGLKATSVLQDVTDVRYAAAAAVDIEIEYLRSDETLGDGVNPCPPMTNTFNATVVEVTCSNLGVSGSGRTIEIVATADGRTILRAEVLINSGVDPNVFVNAWTPMP